MNTNLRDGICESIATQTPFSLRDLITAYESCGSYDFLLTACDYAANHGIGSAGMAVSLLMRDRTLSKMRIDNTWR